MKSKNKPTLFAPPTSLACVATAALAVIFSLPALFATPLYWDINQETANSGTSSTGSWNGVLNNWNTDPTGTGGTPQAVTAATDDLFFSSGTNFTAASAITISGGVLAKSITFQQAGAVTLSGTGITIGNGAGSGISFSNGAGANTISAPITLAANSAFTNSDDSVQTITGGVTGPFNLAINGNSTGGMTLSTVSVDNGGTITNSGGGTNTTTLSAVVGANVTGITQNGATSALTLSGANSAYAGATTLTSGTLNVNNAKALGSGSLLINGGALNSGTATTTLSNTSITGATSGSGSTTISGISDTSALAVGQFVYGTGIAGGAYITTITANTSIAVSAPNTAALSGTLTFGALVPQTWAADFAFTGTANLNLGSGAISLGANAGATRTVTVNANTLTVGGVISNGTDLTTPTINLAKAGAGTLSIYGTNVLGYTGTTTLTAGNLIITGANTSYSGATTVTAGILKLVNPSATAVLQGLGTSAITFNGGTIQMRANGTGSGSQTIVAGNAVTIGSNAVTFDVDTNGANLGNNTMSFGSLTLGTGQVNVVGAHTANVGFSAASTLTGNATINPTTGGMNISGAIGDGGNGFGITKIGSGTLTLGGASTFSGLVTVKEGTLSVSAAAPSGSAGTLGNATSEILVGDISGSLAATLQSSLNSGTGISRNIRIQSGNTGVVTVNANANGSGTGAISGNIILGTDNGAGHGVTLAAGAGGNGPFASANYTGAIVNPTGFSGTAGLVTVNALGTVILSGANTFTGGLTLTTGTVIMNNSSAIGSGTLTINGGTLSNSTANGATVYNNPQIWGGNFGFSNNNLTGFGSVLNMSGTVLLTGTRTLSINILGMSQGGIISDGGSNYGIIYKGGNSTNTLTLGGANTFGGGVTVIGGAGSATLTANNTTALGSGQATLTNSANSRLSLSADLTVDSLTSGINNLTFTAGTGGVNGSQALVFTGGGGTGAAGTATITGGAITSVSITNYGKNYSSAPTIALSSPGGTGTITSAFGSSSIALGSKTLTLAGTNASPATYAGIISGSGGSLVKIGAGTQILSGVNTYTGTTSINAGTLKLGTGGSLAAGTNVSIAAGGTFDVTDLTVSSGTYTWNMASLSASGAATPATITGTAGGTVDMGITPIALTYNGSNPSLTGSGAAISLGGNQITVVVPGAALGTGVYTLVTAGSITGSVDPTPLYTGGNGVAVGATGVVSISGNNLILTVSGGVSNYATWATNNGIPGEPASGDFDHDGLTNLVEYALGKNPTVSSQPPGTFSGGVITFTKGSEAIANGDVNFVIEESTNLVSWTPVVTQNAPDASPTISYTLPTGQSKEFARLKVIQTP